MFAGFRSKTGNIKKPNTDNANVERIASLFISGNKKLVYMPSAIDTGKLDFSIESLKLVDQYLTLTRTTNPSAQALQRLIYCCGSYLCEVLRRLGSKDFNWYTRENAAKKYAPLDAIKPSMATAAVLSDWESFLMLYSVVCDLRRRGCVG